ncbi:CmpA/NrtA family ABC transporter substrate-binding protein [Crenobacter sp. SG2305]|uniref:CmpA/NrtA family ABC transporter substrate-binding protein n=1 Tax=Crenobacter oryzisoli TaxID=3056844 RepID=UPI0025AA325B|nr:CmpA/NrtA family ABC transporter substrate-binding protein [Crenobacter sp. SG2305]MDN0083635.1 CmpA/NrtA family ABC transporter substrate-binding protein [Crenobacter sp. SG2305]
MSRMFLPPVIGSNTPEQRHLRLGFLPLSDCAPLLVASRLGLGRRYGLTLELSRQPSWSVLRDRLCNGELDAAQSLYGMAYAMTLGLGGAQVNMAVLMTLNQNGQAITLARSLVDALQAGRPLCEVLIERGGRSSFAHTSPTGTHALWLNYWLAANQIDPMKEVDSVTLPPPAMAAALARDGLDGFCCGAPWHSVAEADGSGRSVISSSEIWPDHPEKVLACRRDFVERYPNSARALVMALLDACRWLDDPVHRHQAAQWLAEPGLIGLPAELIAPSLIGTTLAPGARPLRFHADGEVNYPYLSDAEWFIGQFRRWGLLREAVDPQLVATVNRTGLYREAAGLLGVPLPSGERRRSVLIDGLVWEGEAQPVGVETMAA